MNNKYTHTYGINQMETSKNTNIKEKEKRNIDVDFDINTDCIVVF